MGKLTWLPILIVVAAVVSAAAVSGAGAFDKSDVQEALRCLRSAQYDLLGKGFERKVFVRFALGRFDKERKGTHLYLATHATSEAQSGRIFHFVVRKGKPDCPALVLINDATFRVVNGKAVFTTPPLGGLSTQRSLLGAVNNLLDKSLLETDSGSGAPCGECRTYYTKRTTSQAKPKEKP